jgi:hypothetical protein
VSIFTLKCEDAGSRGSAERCYPTSLQKTSACMVNISHSVTSVVETVSLRNIHRHINTICLHL